MSTNHHAPTTEGLADDSATTAGSRPHVSAEGGQTQPHATIAEPSAATPAPAAGEEVTEAVAPRVRDHDEALLDLDYAIRISCLHERLFGRVKRGIIALNLLAGAAAVSTFFEGNAALVAASAAVVAGTTIADAVWDYGSLSAAHAADRKRFQRIRARSARMTVDKLDAAVELAKIDCAQSLESLRLPAYNDNLRRHGRSEHLAKLTLLQKLMGIIA
ncbi:hypothetical protein N800_06740 [Lysobacter daejeonensis GH1-9]|uniref:SMODS and SLOG-associating 2TM effector domain-containing protein n=1 Tax=Lysobacter daejeonensis GH1-9 TaxID=1385517 RepID=A0A0A0EWK7_9GAMM|nr:hypothetical protein [Lysobacter daejeonensis]KGM54670.1 hypothetical protein N800_06740 [Lysobacter daejeonensis GH1-9]